MKTTWIVSIYKSDKRFKAGERLVNRYKFSWMDKETIEREIKDICVLLYPKSTGWRVEADPDS